MSRRVSNTLALKAALAVLCLAGYAQADPVLTNGNLTVTINGTPNGAFRTTVFSGTEFYRQGSFVSDFGYQVGSNTGTFSINTTTGSTGITTTVNPNTGTVSSVSVSGTFNGLNFTRTYTLVPGQNVLQTSTTFTNPTGSAATIRGFDTFDPDQGIPALSSFSTFNDRYNLSGYTVAAASDGNDLTVLYGSADNGNVLGFGSGTSPFGLGIASGSDLNTFFGSPFDPNNALQDIGVGVGREFTVAAGGSFSYDFLQAFGNTRAEAEAAFLAAVVPEPATMAMFGLCAAGAGLYGWRRRKAQPAA